MGDDLISRQVAIDALEKKKDKKSQGDISSFYNKIIQNDIDTLMLLPTADRPQGEWASRNPYWHTAICSNCNKVTMFEEWGGEAIEYDFCPNCGAKMKNSK